MTPQQTEAMKLALEALKEAQTNNDGMEKWDRNKKAITALEEALAQPEKDPIEYWSAVEGWVKIDEVREHFDSVGCGTIYKTAGDGRVPLCLAQTEQEPVAWIHNFIDGGISIGKRPADLERHPDRWTALYKEPKPCPTCEALARTVMLDQTSHDTTPPQRKPLNWEPIQEFWRNNSNIDWDELESAIKQAAHGIKENT